MMRREPFSLRYIIILLFLLNFVAGISFINAGIFHHDGIILAQAVENTYKTGQLQPAIRGRYGSVLMNYIISLPFLMSGQNADFPVRFSSILFHALSIIAFFLFVRELFNDNIQAIFASLLLSFTPFYFSPNTYGKEHGMSLFFLILSFFFLYRGTNKKSLILLALSGILFTFSITIRESMLTTIPLFIMFYFNPSIVVRPFKIIIEREKFSLKLLVSFLLPLLASLFFVLFIYLNKEIYQAVFIRDSSSTSFLGIFSYSFKLRLKELFLSIHSLISIFIFFILGILKLLKNKKLSLVFFFLLWFLLIFYFGNTSSYNMRYLDVVFIPVYVFASYALSELYAKHKMIVVAIIIFYVFDMFITMYPVLRFRHGYNGEKQFALYVKEKTEDNAIIIAVDDAPFIEYYGKRKSMVSPIHVYKEIDKFMNDINGYLMKQTPVYLIGSAFRYDRREILKKTLFRNFNITTMGENLTEDYHGAEVRFRLYQQELFKIELKDTLAKEKIGA